MEAHNISSYESPPKNYTGNFRMAEPDVIFKWNTGIIRTI